MSRCWLCRVINVVAIIALGFWLTAFGAWCAHAPRTESFCMHVGIVLGFLVVLPRSNHKEHEL